MILMGSLTALQNIVGVALRGRPFCGIATVVDQGAATECRPTSLCITTSRRVNHAR
jgi:hypothetical protein